MIFFTEQEASFATTATDCSAVAVESSSHEEVQAAQSVASALTIDLDRLLELCQPPVGQEEASRGGKWNCWNGSN